VGCCRSVVYAVFFGRRLRNGGFRAHEFIRGNRN
jgi:hypothetical protein